MGKRQHVWDRAQGLARAGALAGILTSTFGLDIVTAQAPTAFQPPAARLPVMVLTPRTYVGWTIEFSQGFHGSVMPGEGYVGPDGTLQLGPYGSVTVAGLTPEQARLTIERHLMRYVRNPHVQLTLAAPTPLPNEPKTIASAGGAPKPQDPEWHRVPSPGASASVVGLGTPGPLADAVTADPNWKRVGRDGRLLDRASTAVVQTNWRTSDRPPDGVAQFNTANVAAPLPEGPIVQVEPKVEPKSNGNPPPPPRNGETLSPPRQVPGDPVVSVPGGLPPAVPCDGGMPPGPPPTECKKAALPTYVIEPPDILIVASTLELRDQPIQGPHLVRPDGTISLGIYGTAYVAGMTMDQARESIIAVLSQRIKDVSSRNVYVDVMAYNSKFYYVVTDGAGYGETVFRFPITGSETVLDAISQIYGIPPVGSKKKIWVARSFPCGSHSKTLPVDWCAIVQGGDISTNYQVMPGDRIYVQSQGIIRADSAIAKIVSPFERLFGVTLLGASAYNAIAARGATTTR